MNPAIDKLEAPPVRPANIDGERDRLGSVALDQWRGLAIIVVLISHGFYFTGRVHGIGRVGVNLFFFISGILVFRTLSRSRAMTDWGRTKTFWWRRLRRLYPALLGFMGAMVLLTWLFPMHPGQPGHPDLMGVLKVTPLILGYVINYFPAQTPLLLGHLWSLACEMQFYFLAPLLFWFAGRSDRKRMVAFGLVLVVLVLLGAVRPLISKAPLTAYRYNFESAVWPMMLGFFLEYRRGWFSTWPKAMVTAFLWMSFLVCMVIGGLPFFGLEMKLLVVGAGSFLMIPCLLAYLHGRPVPGVAGRCMRWCGERTYSIYLWQQVFTVSGLLAHWWHPVGSLAAIVVGAVSFRIFEFPFLSASRQTREQTKCAAND